MTERRSKEMIYKIIAIIMVLGGYDMVMGDGIVSFYYPNFTVNTGLYSEGDVTYAQGQVQICAGTEANTKGVVWYADPIQLRGFITTFSFLISNNGQGYDGLAFVMQNEGLESVEGPGGSGLGYGDPGNVSVSRGISKSIAIEFDTFQNPELNDPNNNHISVHSNGVNNNNAHENYTLGYTQAITPLTNAKQTVTVEYNPIIAGGLLSVSLVGLTGPVLTISGVSFQANLAMDPTQGSAYVGFTAAKSQFGESFSILSWNFTFTGTLKPGSGIVEIEEQPVAGMNTTFYLTPVDQFGNNMTSDVIDRDTFKAELVQVNTTTQSTSIKNTIGDIPLVYLGNGLYSLSVNSTVSGDFILNITVDGQIFAKQQVEITIEPNKPDASNTVAFGQLITNNSYTALAGELVVVYVQLRDQFGNNITDDSDNVTINAFVWSIEETIPVEVNYNSELTYYEITFNSTVASFYHLNISLFATSLPISNNYHEFTISPNRVAASTSYLYDLKENPIVGDLQVSKLQLKDEFGNEISVILQNSDTVNASLVFVSDTSVVEEVDIHYSGFGTYQLSYKAKRAGQYTLDVTINGVPVQNSHTISTFLPSSISPFNSSITGEVDGGIAGNMETFYIQLRDRFNNNITNISVADVEVVIDSNFMETPVNATIENTGQGVYKVTYNLTVTGNYTINITIEGDYISSSFSSLTIIPASVSASHSYAYGNGVGKQGEAGENQIVYIQARDRFDNNISDVVNISSVVSGSVFINGSFATNMTIQYKGEGLYEGYYNVTKAGQYTTDIFLDESPIFNSTNDITIIPSSVYPPNCFAFGNLSLNTSAGTLVTLNVQTRDIYGNDMITDGSEHDGGLSVFALIYDFNYTDVFYPQIVYSGYSGIWNLSYNVTLTGSYNLSISVNNISIQNPEHDVEIQPAEVSTQTTFAWGAAFNSSKAGSISAFYLFCFDIYNNSIPYDIQPEHKIEVTITAQNTPTYIVVPYIAFNTGSQAYYIRYNLNISTLYEISITIDGVPVSNANSSILTILPAKLNALASNLISPQPIAGEQAYIYLQLRDVYKNNITDYSVVKNMVVLFRHITNHTNVTYLPTTTTLVGGGAYVINYSVITTQPQYTFRITLNGQSVTQSAVLQILPLPADFDATQTIGYINQTEVTAGTEGIVYIQMRDRFGNDLVNTTATGDIIFNMSSALYTYYVDYLPETGEYHIKYVENITGEYNITASIDSFTIYGLPQQVAIAPANTEGAQCTAEGEYLTQAKVKATSTFTVIAKDQFGNLRLSGGDDLRITLDSSGQKQVQGVFKDNENGNYTVSYYVSNKGLYTMHVSVNGAEINGSPFRVDAEYGDGAFATVWIILIAIAGVVFISVVGFFGYKYYKRRRNYELL